MIIPGKLEGEQPVNLTKMMQLN